MFCCCFVFTPGAKLGKSQGYRCLSQSPVTAVQNLCDLILTLRAPHFPHTRPAPALQSGSLLSQSLVHKRLWKGQIGTRDWTSSALHCPISKLPQSLPRTVSFTQPTVFWELHEPHQGSLTLPGHHTSAQVEQKLSHYFFEASQMSPQ